MDTLARYRYTSVTLQSLEWAIADVEAARVIVFWKARSVMAIPVEEIDVEVLLQIGRDGWYACYSRGEALGRLRQQEVWATAPWN